MTMSGIEPFGEFTEAGFRALLQRLKADGYHFARYGEAARDRHVIWRHDVDVSMHRAARLAEIEAEEGVTATYFVNPHCAFHNLLEPEIGRLLDRICSLGHEIGLHFDAEAHGTAAWTADRLEAAIARERAILDLILAAPVRAISWHNPDTSNLLEFDASEVGGLVNAYAASLRRDYVYCSDSNGYWRFQPMAEVIAAGHPRLHLLTHPEWWTPAPMPPSERIDRAIAGRAQAVRRDYDALLRRGGRSNITNKPR
jgi:peptidoglycan/xylan/chitin deacetylase (PgdA/CDA1 family)